GILNIPITGTITGLTVNPFSVHGVGGGGIPVVGHLTLLGQTPNITIGIDLPDPVGHVGVDVPGLPIRLEIGVANNFLQPITTPAIRINTIAFNN
ncbi:hypothetical protein, partial [Mycobacterium paragordonae]